MKEISIIYDDREIATLTAGQRIALSCRGTILKSDIVVKSEGATAIISYNGKNIATLCAYEIATVFCKDTIAKGNIFIKNTSMPESEEE